MSREFEQVAMTTNVVTSYTCDRCGWKTGAGFGSWEGGTLTLSFGYGSRNDLTTHTWDLCDDCGDWLAGEMKA